MTLHGAVRSTKDIDLLVRSPDLDRILDTLRPIGWKFPAFPMTFDRGTDRERVVQSKIEGEQVLTLDLLLAEPLFADVWAARQQVALTGAHLWVVSLDGLTRMKQVAGRPQDIADLQKLGRG